MSRTSESSPLTCASMSTTPSAVNDLSCVGEQRAGHRESSAPRAGTDTADYRMRHRRGLPLPMDVRQIAALARRHGLSGYDAAYLETAMRRRAKLATLDRKLAAAATGEGVSIDAG